MLKLRGTLEPFRESNPQLFAIISWYVDLLFLSQAAPLTHFEGSIIPVRVTLFLDVDLISELLAQNCCIPAHRGFQKTYCEVFQQDTIFIELSRIPSRDSSR